MGFDGFKPRQDLSGYTAIPNEWFDEVLKEVDNLAELKIVQIVFRKTYGWVVGWDTESQRPVYKLEDDISYSQFEELTGMSRASISEGIKRAVNHGLIVRVKRGEYKNMTCSKYRIRMVGEEPDNISEEDELEEATVVKEEPKLKERVEEEIKPEAKEEAKPKQKKSQYERYRLKQPKDYNAVDMTYYFSDKYNETLKVWYGTVTQKDRTLMKQLITGYGAETVVKAIDWLMANYRKLIDSYPSVAVLYGFRTTIFPSAQNVESVDKNDVRQSHITEEEVKAGGAVDTW